MAVIRIGQGKRFDQIFVRERTVCRQSTSSLTSCPLAGSTKVINDITECRSL
jgi:hypothetical protein